MTDPNPYTPPAAPMWSPARPQRRWPIVGLVVVGIAYTWFTIALLDTSPHSTDRYAGYLFLANVCWLIAGIVGSVTRLIKPAMVTLVVCVVQSVILCLMLNFGIGERSEILKLNGAIIGLVFLATLFILPTRAERRGTQVG